LPYFGEESIYIDIVLFIYSPREDGLIELGKKRNKLSQSEESFLFVLGI